jgi:predicted DNA-binding WGR domain protein
VSFTPVSIYDTPPIFRKEQVWAGNAKPGTRPPGFGAQGDPYRIRLVFIGANAANKSGESFKFWQVTGRWGETDVEVRWGRIGVKGQAQVVGIVDGDIFGRVEAKLRKGYRYDNETPTPKTQTRPDPSKVTPPIVIALRDARWSELNEDQLLTTAAVRGWARMDVEGLDRLVPWATCLRFYADRGENVWCVGEHAHGMKHALLGVCT